MTDFNDLRRVCKESSTITVKVIDDFLLPYAAKREELNKEMDQRLLRFKNVTKNFPADWVGLFKAQYIAHRVFKKNGLIKKYLQHVALKELLPQHRNFLEQQSAIPWRFAFTRIISKRENDFYEMEDVFSGERYLIFSPSVSQILLKDPVVLWFNLIGFNGACWQSYGPVTSFSGFGQDDIFFFATELNPAIETDDALMADIDNNPFPYMMLISGSAHPFIFTGKDEIMHVVAEYPIENFDSSPLKANFKIEYAQGIYRFSPKIWSEYPHFAQAYYVENKKLLLLDSQTTRGFAALVAKLNKYGLGLDAEPDICVRLSMLGIIELILGKTIQFNPYEDLFQVQSTPEEKAHLEQLNQLLQLALPPINAGQQPDYKLLAKETGLAEETVRELLVHTIGKIDKLKQKY